MVPHEGQVTDGMIATGAPVQSTMDAVTQGTVEGVSIFINIVAMLLVLTALIAIINQLFGLLPGISGKPITLQSLFGAVMAPIVWLTGIPWSEAQTAGALMGTKTVLNEFIAYLDMVKLSPAELSERSRVMMTYSLCGFANFASLGIMIGGTVVMEMIFSLPGIGRELIEAVSTRDYAIVQGIVMIFGLIVVFTSFIGDLLGYLLDRRVTLS
jgi:CNT family concentrative nucleoside transporter